MYVCVYLRHLGYYICVCILQHTKLQYCMCVCVFCAGLCIYNIFMLPTSEIRVLVHKNV